METIVELFATLNAAIDSGAMTQEILTFFVIEISRRVQFDWEAGSMSLKRLRRISREMEHLNRHWQACKPPSTGCSSARSADPEEYEEDIVRILSAMKVRQSEIA